MKRTFTFWSGLLAIALVAGSYTLLEAAPKVSLGGAARSMSQNLGRANSSLSRGGQNHARSLPSGGINSSRIGNFKQHASRVEHKLPKINNPIGQARPQGKISKDLSNKLAPLVKQGKFDPKVSLPTQVGNKLHPSIGNKIAPIVGKSPVLTKVGPKFNPIIANPPKTAHCLPPCFPPPHHHHHHNPWPWYLSGVGIGLGAGYGGYGGGYTSTTVCEPVVIQVCPPANPVVVTGPVVPASAEETLPVENGDTANATAENTEGAQTPAETTQPTSTTTPPLLPERLPQVRAGAVVDLRGRDFGADLGGVTLKVNEVELGCLVTDWKDDGVKATLPTVGVSAPTKAQLTILLRDGEVAQTIEVELLPVGEAGPVVASRNTP